MERLCNLQDQTATDKMERLNATRLLSEAGDDTAVIRNVFELHGISAPSPGQIRKWRMRNRIPSDWLTKLLSVLEKDSGKHVRIADYMESDECEKPRSKDRSKPTGELPATFE